MTEFDIDIRVNEHVLTAKGNVSWAYNGIGPYEYWGQRGFDKGILTIDDLNIDELTLTNENGRERKIPFNKLSKNMQREIENQIEQYLPEPEEKSEYDD